MRIALISGLQGGHHQINARLYTQAFVELGHDVLALVPDPEEVQAWVRGRTPEAVSRLHCAIYRAVEPISPCWRLRSLYVPLARWRAVYCALQAASARSQFVPDVVFFCWLDDYLAGAMPAVCLLQPLLFPYRWSGIYFHPRHLRIAEGHGVADAARAAGMLKTRGCRGVVVFDEGVAVKLSQQIHRPVFHVPDVMNVDLPSADTALVQRIRVAAGGRRVIGLLGGMEKRKGVLELLDVMEQCRRPDWFFLFAGTLGEGADGTFAPQELSRLRRLALNPPPNAFFHLERVSDEAEFNALFRLCDVIAAVYRDFPHSSGILTKAAVLGRPLVVADGFFMAERVRDYRLGMAVPAGDCAKMEEAIDIVLDPEKLALRVGAPRFREYRESHSMSAFREALAKVVPILC